MNLIDQDLKEEDPLGHFEPHAHSHYQRLVLKVGIYDRKLADPAQATLHSTFAPQEEKNLGFHLHESRLNPRDFVRR